AGSTVITAQRLPCTAAASASAAAVVVLPTPPLPTQMIRRLRRRLSIVRIDAPAGRSWTSRSGKHDAPQGAPKLLEIAGVYIGCEELTQKHWTHPEGAPQVCHVSFRLAPAGNRKARRRQQRRRRAVRDQAMCLNLLGFLRCEASWEHAVDDRAAHMQGQV